MDILRDLMDFLDSSVTMFHAINECEKVLQKSGFIYLPENEKWDINKGKYYTKRNSSSLIAFDIAEGDYHFQISAAHSDSPTFKLKDKPIIEANGYLKLNVEGYGGMINATWLDKPLTLSGRVMVNTDTGIETRLLHINRDLFIIPNVPIHFNREINKGFAFNNQVDMLPIFSAGNLKESDFDNMIAKELGIESGDILAKDLYLVNRQKAAIIGFDNELISSGRLDDLECVYTSLRGFVEAENKNHINVFAVFDNEEVGSVTKQGAMSTFLASTLDRVNTALRKSKEEYYTAIAKSMLISCDNAHAIHPNHPELFDVKNRPVLNQGIAIKESANQKYTTDAFSRSILRKILEKKNIPYQTFANRSDIAGGSTLGNLSNTAVSMNAVDIGLPQLAMHSAYETAGTKDVGYAFDTLKAFFETNIDIKDDSVILEV
ncbi:M18 family aminopeptidase [Lachnoanaerobaculum umeaense]|uniref:M18 family aminopeptidase n=1 Tax=Lachnoanaerobaculum umeaense TaxID=617123 RepID=A0A385Q5U9_9FIRM|nr:M18 family aminopeptidase [Lachnoanaerobaculum umeaense]AYB00544.1 M18 family aminopeptidase [Lachnoanaerobaculum umeaense]PZW91520.1 aspartyl aminopeptidase [Lachnoanaerobaculum umeaense]